MRRTADLLARHAGAVHARSQLGALGVLRVPTRFTVGTWQEGEGLGLKICNKRRGLRDAGRVGGRCTTDEYGCVSDLWLSRVSVNRLPRTCIRLCYMYRLGSVCTRVHAVCPK
jgi:hypothetical protein